MTAAEALVDAATKGSGTVLVITGPAGIGKTALLAHVVANGGDRGCLVLQTNGVPTETNLPFAGLHQLLVHVLHVVDSSPPRERDTVRAALGLAEGPGLDLYRVALAVLELLSALADERPVVVVADDVHWLDRPTVDVLAFVARRLAAEPVAALFVVRSGERDPFATLDFPHLTLGPLSGDASRQLLQDRFPALDAATRRRVLVEAIGNPLALVELPTLRSDDDGPAAQGLGLRTVTAQLEASFASRSAELPPAGRQLTLAAACDPRCDLGRLAAAASLASGAHVGVEDIQAAVDAGLLQVVGDVVHFRHPLIRSAIYQSSGVAERRRLHDALARVIAPSDDRRIWHRAAAAVWPNNAVAEELAELAERASLRGAGGASIPALERAAALSSTEQSRSSLLLRAAELAADLGRRKASLRLQAAADPTAAGPTGLARAVIARQAAYPGQHAGAPSMGELVAATQQAIESGADQLAAEVVWAAASRCWWMSADASDREAVAALIPSLGLPAESPLRIAMECYVGQTAWPIDLTPLLRRLAATSTDFETLRFAGSAAYALGDLNLAFAAFGAALQPAREQARLGQVVRLLALQGWTAIWTTDLDTATAIAAEADDLTEALGHPAWRLAVRLELALIGGLRGRWDEAAERVAALFSEHDPRDVRLHRAMSSYGLAVGALGLGRYDDAYGLLTRLGDPAGDIHHFAAPRWIVADLVEAARGSGRLPEASALIEELLGQTRGCLPAGTVGVLHARALLAPPAERLALLDEAQTVWADSRSADRPSLQTGRLLMARGQALHELDRTHEARAAFRSAAETFGPVGALGFVERAKRALRNAGGAAGPIHPSAVSRLTPQELQIARLAAQGMSNRQIAEHLFLSHRTVGSHLYNLFPKLGITTRSELSRALSLDGAGGVVR
jgi:DNA-binding CsgD family transcriptional regulator